MRARVTSGAHSRRHRLTSRSSGASPSSDSPISDAVVSLSALAEYPTPVVTLKDVGLALASTLAGGAFLAATAATLESYNTGDFEKAFVQYESALTILAGYCARVGVVAGGGANKGFRNGTDAAAGGLAKAAGATEPPPATIGFIFANL